MIKKIRLKNFKRFRDQLFDFSDHVVMAGPNNSGKTTLLQAIVVWNLALQKWKEQRGPGTGSKAKQRTGVPITRNDFTAIPLREMKLLWHNTMTSLKDDELSEGQKRGEPRYVSIALEGEQLGQNWSLEFELHHSSSELIHVRPKLNESETISPIVWDFNIVHVPPFSGIGVEETRVDKPYQDLLIGQGKAGDILRNLLYEVSQDQGKWGLLCGQVEEIFGYRLLPPAYKGRPFIVAEYLPEIPVGKGKNGLHQLDISSAGSGFHQVLLLLSFLYARPAALLLLDEPDAHLHVILQKQINDRLRSICAMQHSQLIIATHSEVLLDSASPDQVMSFYPEPHRLLSSIEKDQVRKALKQLTAMDILLSERANGVLYLESESDFNLLQTWAKVLGHKTYEWFIKNPFWKPLHGNRTQIAKDHFFALRSIKPTIQGYILLDGDARNLSDHEIISDGLSIGRWRRYETESYLILPEVLIRFIRQRGGLFASPAIQYLDDQLPPAVFHEPHTDNPFLNNTPFSKTFLPAFFDRTQLPIRKNDYFQIAEQMTKEEIHPEVILKLDEIAKVLGF